MIIIIEREIEGKKMGNASNWRIINSTESDGGSDA